MFSSHLILLRDQILWDSTVCFSGFWGPCPDLLSTPSSSTYPFFWVSWVVCAQQNLPAGELEDHQDLAGKIINVAYLLLDFCWHIATVQELHSKSSLNVSLHQWGQISDFGSGYLDPTLKFAVLWMQLALESAEWLMHHFQDWDWSWLMEKWKLSKIMMTQGYLFINSYCWHYSCGNMGNWVLWICESFNSLKYTLNSAFLSRQVDYINFRLAIFVCVADPIICCFSVCVKAHF